MATLDLDPVFVKALRLLHSKAKDSASQLRAMVEESIAARRSQKASGSVDSDHRSVSKSSKDDDTNLTKKREPEKRSSEKVKQDVSELSGPSEAKRPKQESSPTSSHSKDEKKLKEKEREKEKAKKEKERREQKEKEKERLEKERQRELEKEREKEKQKEEESDEETEEEEEEEDDGIPVDADDFAIGLGISCEVCRQFDVSSGNQLVECQECHALYHQECHKPPVTEQDVNDPRFVWYCSKCSRSMKKMVAQKPPKHKPEKPSTPNKEVVSAVKLAKPEAAPATFAFRRLEVKPTTSSTKETPSIPASSKPLLGLASLAANLSKPAATKLETGKPSQPAWKSELTKSGAKDGASEKITRGDGTKTAKESKTGEVTKPGSPAGSSSGSGSKGGGGSSGKQSPVSSASASSLASANKRLQIMKKNAARQQEKRVHIK